jgi:hypothetical protein
LTASFHGKAIALYWQKNTITSEIMSADNRFIVFAYDHCERAGGTDDIHYVTATFKDAEDAAQSDDARNNSDTIEIYDIQEENIVCSFYRTVQDEWVRDE